MTVPSRCTRRGTPDRCCPVRTPGRRSSSRPSAGSASSTRQQQFIGGSPPPEVALLDAAPGTRAGCRPKRLACQRCRMCLTNPDISRALGPPGTVPHVPEPSWRPQISQATATALPPARPPPPRCCRHPDPATAPVTGPLPGRQAPAPGHHRSGRQAGTPSGRRPPALGTRRSWRTGWWRPAAVPARRCWAVAGPRRSGLPAAAPGRRQGIPAGPSGAALGRGPGWCAPRPVSGPRIHL